MDQTPEEFVREFLVAYRDWELEAARKEEAAEAEMRRHAEDLDNHHCDDDPGPAIAAQYQALLARFLTPRRQSQKFGPNWQSPPRADVNRTVFTGVVPGRGRATVSTLEEGHPVLPPNKCEYVLALVEGHWRLDDRRVCDYDGRWIRLVL